MLYSRSKDHMFRPVVAIIRSLSFDIFKIILYNYHTQTEALVLRSPHQTCRCTIV